MEQQQQQQDLSRKFRSHAINSYEFDRFLQYEDMSSWLTAISQKYPHLVAITSYGKSYAGRDLLLVTVTETIKTTALEGASKSSSSVEHAASKKPAHWIDANIHSTEVTSGVAALYLIQYLVVGYEQGVQVVIEALRTRAFYIAPRVNPDGVEAALADRPMYHRSSIRPWPYSDGYRWSGLHAGEDIDGDGRILTMRIADPDGAWVEHGDEPRVMIPVGPLGAPNGEVRYRLLQEGRIEDYDGFTINMPRDSKGLDLNRNFPAGWGTSVLGSGDHPLSEPEVDCLVRAIRARPNICGYNAYHTSGGFLLRPSSSQPDSKLPPDDIFLYNEFGKHMTPLTTYPVHSVYEDLTWDKSKTMGGAGDDWAYEHLGVFSWTTEFWDVVYHATGIKSSTDIWYVGPTVEQEMAVCRWSDEHAPGSYVHWYSYDHPQLGRVELGGADTFRLWSNAPPSHLRSEIAPHAKAAVYQAMASPRLEIKHAIAKPLGNDDSNWRVELGVSNTGWLGTEITKYAKDNNLVTPIVVEITGNGVVTVGCPARAKVGQLSGRSAFLLHGGNYGTPDRLMHSWVVQGSRGAEVTFTVCHALSKRR